MPSAKHLRIAWVPALADTASVLLGRHNPWPGLAAAVAARPSPAPQNIRDATGSGDACEIMCQVSSHMGRVCQARLSMCCAIKSLLPEHQP